MQENNEKLLKEAIGEGFDEGSCIVAHSNTSLVINNVHLLQYTNFNREMQVVSVLFF